MQLSNYKKHLSPNTHMYPFLISSVTSVCWNTKEICSLVAVYVHFGGTCRLQHQSTQMMEEARTSVMLENFYPTTKCYNPENSHGKKGVGRFLKYYLYCTQWTISNIIVVQCIKHHHKPLENHTPVHTVTILHLLYNNLLPYYEWDTTFLIPHLFMNFWCGLCVTEGNGGHIL